MTDPTVDPPPLTCRVARGPLWLAVVAGTGFVLLGVAIALTGPTGVVVGVAAVAAFGAVAVAAGRRLRADDGSPVVVVDARGVLDVRLGGTAVPWPSVRQVVVRPGATLWTREQRSVVVSVDGGHEPLVIATRDLDPSAEALAAGIDERRTTASGR